MAISYLNFDFAIEAVDAEKRTYRVRVLDSPAGQAQATFDLPFSDEQLEIYILRMGRVRNGRRSALSPEGQAARDLGQRLYNMIFTDSVGTCLLRSIDTANDQNKGLRFRLRLSDAPDLVDVPWEYFYDAARDRFLGYSEWTPFVRHMDLPLGRRPLAVQPPLRVLTLIASPIDHQPLDVEREWANIQRAVKPLQERGLLQMDRLERPTLPALQAQLRREQYHIFHFIGHGGMDTRTGESVLVMEGENSHSRLVHGPYLGAVLDDHRSLRLCLLNACEGARASRTDPFAGVAQHLVRGGMPAVIAMQFEITDQAAIALSGEFYAALADNYPVDAALAAARKSVFIRANDVEWGTPVLYLRAEDGELFDVKQAPSDYIEEMAQDPEIASSAAGVEANNQKSKTSRYLLIMMVTVVSVILVYSYIRYEQPFAALILSTSTLSPPISTPLPPTPTLSPAQMATLEARTEIWGTAPPTDAITGTEWVEAHSGITFIHIPTGAFLMGSTEEQIDYTMTLCKTYYDEPTGNGCARSGRENESPQHEVIVDAFWIMKTEVTNAEYSLFMKANGYADKRWWSEEGWSWRSSNDITAPEYWEDNQFNASHPVMGISWYEAQSFANWFAAETEAHVRLPTEAEWEKAARGTNGWHFPWGNEWDDILTNYCDINCPSEWADELLDDGFAYTAPVGHYPDSKSLYGVLDMAGNVSEWTADWYAEDYYNIIPPDENPVGPQNGDRRVGRGGSWFNAPDAVNAAARSANPASSRYSTIGMRLVWFPSF